MKYANPIAILSLSSIAVGQGDGRCQTPSLARQEALRQQHVEEFGRLPLSFEANRGQTDLAAEFVARGPGYTLFLTSCEIVLHLAGNECSKTEPSPSMPCSSPKIQASSALRMRLVGGRTDPRVRGLEEQPGKVNYFLGNDPGRWLPNVPTYAKAEYEDVYSGVDLVLYGNQGQLEYDFVLAPGADPRDIALAFEGIDGLEIDPSGDLVLHTSGGDVRQRRPFAYQEIDGVRQPHEVVYVLEGSNQVGFAIDADVDACRPLIIDPVLMYSTYLGGSSFDRGYGIDVDSSGCAYVTGQTHSFDFPTGSSLQGTLGGSSDAFITKLDPSGSALIYSTYLGGSAEENDLQGDIVIDDAGDAYVTGSTSSGDFPTTPGAFQQVPPGFFSRPNDNAFVTKLAPDGSALVYSTYLGGTNLDEGWEIELDSFHHAIIVGRTFSHDFPVANAFQVTNGGLEDAFVSELDASGATLLYSTYLGGSSVDRGIGLDVDDTGHAYVAGYTFSNDFPTTSGAVQTTNAGQGDGFVTKLDLTGSGLVYSTYLGGALEDAAMDVTSDSAGNSYVTGFTRSDDFPTANAFQPSYADGSDAFLTKLDATGSTLVFSTYLGGSGGISSDGFTCFGQDVGSGIVLDASNNIYLTGFTSSCDFPAVDSVQPKNGNDSDAFVAKFNASASTLVYSTFLGGSGREHEVYFHESLVGGKIVLDGQANAYVIGYTESIDFPTVNAFQASSGSTSGDVFVAKLGVPEGIAAHLDIKPGSCPNSFNRKSHGVLPVALVGDDSFDVGLIDVASIVLSRTDGVGGSVSPNEGPPGPHTTLEDVATPFDGGSCACHGLEGDGIPDLMMHFRSDDVVASLELGDLSSGALVELLVSGSLLDGTPFTARDCIRLIPPGTAPGQLSVQASVAHAWIDAVPPDENLDGGGFASFERTYPLTSVVTLTAPRLAEGRRFLRWVIDGVDQPLSLETLELVVSGDHALSAVYELRHAGRR